MHALINIYACNNNLQFINIINKMLVYYIVIVYILYISSSCGYILCIIPPGRTFYWPKKKCIFNTVHYLYRYGKNHIDMEYDEVTKK